MCVYKYKYEYIYIYVDYTGNPNSGPTLGPIQNPLFTYALRSSIAYQGLKRLAYDT